MAADPRFTQADPRIEPIPESGCWLWLGYVNASGYGRAFDPRSKKIRGTHRLVWERLIGPIPQGMVLDHMCRVRACCNPSHLRVVTPRVNVLENSLSGSAKNAAKSVCTKCGGEYFDASASRRLRRCRTCANESYRAYRVRNREKRQERDRARRAANREKFRAAARARYWAKRNAMTTNSGGVA